MTVRFRKKISRQRGSHTHGWGSKKKHRGGGSKGGHGYGGSHKHKYSYIVSKEPWHYGYKGFVKPRQKKDRTINLDALDKLEGNDINLTKLGYDKLLGSGSVSRAITVKVKKFSKVAKEKVEKAGGRIINI